ncbi:MAG: hypothetical protein JSR60_14430 [Proteobacteria bacterium]|nr:hypothetical protein [Pseudomonadota bacterium]
MNIEDGVTSSLRTAVDPRGTNLGIAAVVATRAWSEYIRHSSKSENAPSYVVPTLLKKKYSSLDVVSSFGVVMEAISGLESGWNVVDVSADARWAVMQKTRAAAGNATLVSKCALCPMPANRAPIYATK